MKRVACIITIMFLAVIFVGCATGKIAKPEGMQAARYASVSATKIGCLPDEITITDLDPHGGLDRTRDWYATCKGQTYFCTGINNGHGGTTDVSCMKKK